MREIRWTRSEAGPPNVPVLLGDDDPPDAGEEPDGLHPREGSEHVPHRLQVRGIKRGRHLPELDVRPTLAHPHPPTAVREVGPVPVDPLVARPGSRHRLGDRPGEGTESPDERGRLGENPSQTHDPILARRRRPA